MAGEVRRRRLRALLALAGARDLDPGAVEGVFVHESAARERGLESNERLEFLGDSILGMIVARWAYEHFSSDDEGTLSTSKARIVNDPALALTASRLGFGELLVLGKGARNEGGAENTSILAGAFEAFIAALFLNVGLDAARAFVQREHIATVDCSTDVLLDAKTRLQNLSHQRWSATPLYVDRSAGPPHRPVFTSEVVVDGRTLGRGEGPSKKAAQLRAAQEALVSLQAITR